MTHFETYLASTLKQALEFKTQRNIAVVAGGTDILVRLHDAIEKPSLLVLDGISQLRKINVTEKQNIIGPLVTFTEIEESAALRKYAPQLCQAASVAGSVQIRNRATVGGNIANASPAGDLIPPLYALGASLELMSSKGKRFVDIENFFTGPGKTVLKSNELITGIKIPKARNFGFFARLGTRKALAISKVSVAVNFVLKAGKVTDIRIALGAVAPTVIRAQAAEEILENQKLDCDNIEKAALAVIETARPIDDIRSNAEYRKQMTGVLFRRGMIQFIGAK
jgi:CO/xanthine dehydrogenase FAD-binding subunit